MEKRKGFTLIELLAVIVILAIIAIIGIPIVSRVIEKTRVESFRLSNSGIIQSIESSCMAKKLNKQDCENIYPLKDGKFTNELKVKGKIPEEGMILVNGKDTILYTKNGNDCAKKLTTGYVEVGKIVNGICEIKNVSYKQNDTTDGLQGDGTSDSPFQISSIEDLVYFSNNSSDDKYKNTYLILTSSLDFNDEKSYRNPNINNFGDINEDGTTELKLIDELNKGKGFNPIVLNNIGNVTIDGNNKIINNLYINRTDNVALFGSVYNFDKTLEIKNLRIYHANITGSNHTAMLIGYFAGYGNLNINNVSVNGTVTGDINVGSVIGQMSSGNLDIENVIIEGKVIGRMYVGSLTGTSWAKVYIHSIINNADIEGDVNGSYIGGIIGQSSAVATFNNFANYGDVSGQNYVGGLIGETGQSVNFKNGYNYGNINSSMYSGGIIGKISHISNLIENTYNYGNITGESNVGGISGDIVSTTFNNVENNGTINSMSSVGGIVGSVGKGPNKISNAINRGNINTYDWKYSNCYAIGGIIGSSGKGVTIENSINYGNITSTCSTYNQKIDGISGFPIENLINTKNEGIVTIP